MNKLQIILTYRPYINCAELWKLGNFADLLEQEEAINKVKVNHSTRLSKVSTVLDKLKKSNTPDRFDILHPTEHFSKRVGMAYWQLKDRNISHLSISKLDNIISSRENWLPIITNQTCFVHSRLINDEFNTFQNLDDIKMHEALGLDHSHLPKVNNGEKPPFNKEVIDTSVNPGYWCFKKGYIESVGSEMWLGKPFFEAVGLNREVVLSCDWLETQVLDNDVIHLKAYHKPFDSAEGAQREIQFKLRKLLFG